MFVRAVEALCCVSIRFWTGRSPVVAFVKTLPRCFRHDCVL
jgi:hypothetical protein